MRPAAACEEQGSHWQAMSGKVVIPGQQFIPDLQLSTVLASPPYSAPHRLIRDPKDMEALSELGVLFLLFEMGLELSLDRLKVRVPQPSKASPPRVLVTSMAHYVCLFRQWTAGCSFSGLAGRSDSLWSPQGFDHVVTSQALAKFAFGLGTLQMVFCTAIFTAFALPAGQGLGTKVLESLAHAPHNLVSIRSVDEVSNSPTQRPPICPATQPAIQRSQLAQRSRAAGHLVRKAAEKGSQKLVT